MNTLLVLHTSLNGRTSLSSSLACRYVSRWRREHPSGRVIERDLAARPVPHLTAERFAAFGKAPGDRTAGEAAWVAGSDALIAELKAADEIVVALPMYNFGILSSLKAWIDHVARAGETFRYTETGPVGLVGASRALVFATRGGRYEGTALDTQTGYMETFFGFIGVDDVEFVYAEGTAMGEESLNAAIEQATTQLDRVLGEAA